MTDITRKRSEHKSSICSYARKTECYNTGLDQWGHFIFWEKPPTMTCTWKTTIIALPKWDAFRQDAGLRLSDCSNELLDALAQRKFSLLRTQQVHNNTRYLKLRH